MSWNKIETDRSCKRTYSRIGCYKEAGDSMERRTVLKYFVGGGLTAGLSGAGINYWPDEGLINPCEIDTLHARQPELDLINAAWEGIDASQFIDCHTHLIGTGDSNSGIWLHPDMQDPLVPEQYIRLQFYLNASCIIEDNGIDEQYVDQLLQLHRSFPTGAKLMLLAFDYRHDDNGQINKKKSAFAIPNEYTARVVQQYPDKFEWAASIHPYREDCVEALDWAVKHGAKAIKWLPPVMNIDPGSSRCDRFYAAAVKHNIPILTHAGDEHAVAGVESQALGNPLLLRRPLDQGVKIIVAHCAILGSSPDLDKGKDGKETENFQLFARLMNEPQFENLLYGDISAILQINRLGPNIGKIIERDEWHSRLLHGSDYPLPGVMPLFSSEEIVEAGFLDSKLVEPLQRIRQFNPVLYDFVLKRNIQSNGKRLSSQVFETRRILK